MAKDNPLVKRDERGRLLPGSVNNPRGRPPTGLSLGELGREMLGRNDHAGTRALLKFAFDVAMGQPLSYDVEYLRKCAAARDAGVPEPAPPDHGQVVVPDVKERLYALNWLASWLFEKPVQREDVTSGGQAVSGAPPPGLRALSTDDLRSLVEIRRKVLAAGDSSSE